MNLFENVYSKYNFIGDIISYISCTAESTNKQKVYEYKNVGIQK